MKYEIKNFENKENQKLVGLWVIDDSGKRLAIDKLLPIVEGKNPEQYVQEAIGLCQQEIVDWQNSGAIVGKTWNSETNSFE
jgi:hypothetical protein